MNLEKLEDVKLLQIQVRKLHKKYERKVKKLKRGGWRNLCDNQSSIYGTLLYWVEQLKYNLEEKRK